VIVRRTATSCGENGTSRLLSNWALVWLQAVPLQGGASRARADSLLAALCRSPMAKGQGKRLCCWDSREQVSPAAPLVCRPGLLQARRADTTSAGGDSHRLAGPHSTPGPQGRYKWRLLTLACWRLALVSGLQPSGETRGEFRGLRPRQRFCRASGPGFPVLRTGPWWPRAKGQGPREKTLLLGFARAGVACRASGLSPWPAPGPQGRYNLCRWRQPSLLYTSPQAKAAKAECLLPLLPICSRCPGLLQARRADTTSAGGASHRLAGPHSTPGPQGRYKWRLLKLACWRLALVSGLQPSGETRGEYRGLRPRQRFCRAFGPGFLKLRTGHCGLVVMHI
jgi:hypothetical protein